MLYSFIVPVYNVEKYLKECIDSVLSQTYCNFELILVDDGSADLSGKICDEYVQIDGRVRVIHKENGGATSARKLGLSISRGDFVIFIDGDDLIKHELLEKANQILKDAEYDICCFGYEIISDKGFLKSMPINYRKGAFNKRQIEDEIFPTLITGSNGKRFPPSLWGKIFKKELVLPIQEELSNEIIMGEDSCVSYVSIFYAKSIYIFDENFYCYRLRDDSLTRQKHSKLSWEEPLLRAQFYLKFLPEDVFKDQIARITVHSLFNVATSFFYKMRYLKAKKLIKNHLCDNRYTEFLRLCRFKKNIKEYFAYQCIKRKLIFPIFIYSKLI